MASRKNMIHRMNRIVLRNEKEGWRGFIELTGRCCGNAARRWNGPSDRKSRRRGMLERQATILRHILHCILSQTEGMCYHHPVFPIQCLKDHCVMLCCYFAALGIRLLISNSESVIEPYEILDAL
jgi:hypothetical protein